LVTGSACLGKNAWEDTLHLANSIVFGRSKLSGPFAKCEAF
jgi:hypothetical protein